MKRMWIGVGFLLFLLVAGIFVTLWAVSFHSRLESQLTDAVGAAAAENWDTAQILFHSAESRWEDRRKLTAVIADHDPMEEIDSLFSQMEIYLRLRDQNGFSSTGAQLASRVRAMSDSQSISWWNFF